MLTKTKTKPAPAPEPTEFELAKAAYAEASAKRTELAETVDALTLARSLAANGDGQDRVRADLKAAAAPYARLARRPAKINDAIDVAELAQRDFLPTFFEAGENFEAAKRRQTDKLALKLQPAHRGAVKKMAKAVEDLSRATAAERECRETLTRTAPLPSSKHLPDLSGELGVGCLSDYSGVAWTWARNLRKLGVL